MDRSTSSPRHSSRFSKAIDAIRMMSRRTESAQALLFFAVIAPLLLLTMVLAIEAGSLFAEHQRLQSAADVAALVGAQDLPCATSNSTCITTAENDACTYATNNGFSG